MTDYWDRENIDKILKDCKINQNDSDDTITFKLGAVEALVNKYNESHIIVNKIIDTQAIDKCGYTTRVYNDFNYSRIRGFCNKHPSEYCNDFENIIEFGKNELCDLFLENRVNMVKKIKYSPLIQRKDSIFFNLSDPRTGSPAHKAYNRMTDLSGIECSKEKRGF